MFKIVKKAINRTIGKTMFKTKRVIAKKIKGLCVNYILPFVYVKSCVLPVENTALFVEIRGKEISSNYRGIIHYLRAKYPDVKIKTYFLEMGEKGHIEYYKRCKKLVKLMARAKYIFIDDCSNVIAALPIRKKTKLVQTWHGCGALKKFGLCYDATEKYYGREDIFTVSSENVIDYYAKSTGLQKNKIKAIGVPRTDLFFQDKYKKRCEVIRRNFYKEHHIDENKKIILYAPTYRNHIETSVKTKKFDTKYLKEALGDEYIVLCKYHPVFSGKRSDFEDDGFMFDITDSIKIEYAMGICDALVTDYSSLIFEYSLLDKPAYFYAYDLDEYIEKRGLYIDYNDMPGPICYTLVDLAQNINSKVFDSNKMKAFRRKYMGSCDGNATKRLLELLRN